jgi:feruloyl esterase
VIRLRTPAALALSAVLALLACAAPATAQAAPTACAALARTLPARTDAVDARPVAASKLSLTATDWEKSPGMNIAGQGALPDNPAFCRVSFTLRPATGSAIHTEVWLPARGWNGKFLGVGNFGWGGAIPHGTMLTGLAQGYAVAANDTGHDESQGHGGRFALGQPERLADYAGRANHLMTEQAKLLIARFYGRPASRSYFIGCSLGGLQALIEAQRYPEDYDGIVAGAPPNPLANFNAAQLWPQYLLAQDPQRFIPAEGYAMVTRAAVKACAGAVGQAYGYIENPAACGFRPRQLLCKAGQTSDCLTAKQADFLDRIYQGPTDPATGRRIFSGPAQGSEGQLAMFASGREFTNAADFFRYAAFQSPGWSPLKLDWSKDVAAADAATHGDFTVAPDLDAFLRRGGKLLLYIGWNDYHHPGDLMGWHDAVLARAKAAGIDGAGSLRLFAIPGMDHCQGGPGCDTFDKLALIDGWSGGGAAPDAFVAHKWVDGASTREQRVCAYPRVSRYSGSAAMDRRENFTCQLASE